MLWSRRDLESVQDVRSYLQIPRAAWIVVRDVFWRNARILGLDQA